VGSLLIIDAAVVKLDNVLSGQAVFCRDGRIERIGLSDGLRAVPADEKVDARGQYLAPAYIDLHIHGAEHFLVDKGAQDVEGLCRLLPRYGVGGFLPTVTPRPVPQDAEFLAGLAKVPLGGTRILGFHLEGPFLAMTGALPSDSLGEPDPQRVRALMEAAAPYRAIFSVSPELKGLHDLLPIMQQNEAPVFMTHTMASVKEAERAIEAGVRHATHFYDVFPYPPEADPGARQCGTVEAVLADGRVSVDFILDGEHVDPVAVKLALLCKGPDRVCLATDANVGAGLPPGRHRFTAESEIEFAYPGGPARGTENSRHPHSLAGSGLTLDLAVRNAVRLLGMEPALAIRMASTNPAQVLGLDNVKGRVEEGFDADLVLLNDSLEVKQTWIGGECCFGQGEE